MINLVNNEKESYHIQFSFSSPVGAELGPAQPSLLLAWATKVISAYGLQKAGCGLDVSMVFMAQGLRQSKLIWMLH